MQWPAGWCNLRVWHSTHENFENRIYKAHRSMWDMRGLNRPRSARHARPTRGIVVLHCLLIEFLDEFIFGVREAAWPQIRSDLQLSYAQIGLLLGLPGYWLKLLLLACLGLSNAGWYSILKAQLYCALRDKSGTELAVSNIFSLFGAVIPWTVGLIADSYGLHNAMLLLFLNPVVLLVGLPWRNRLGSWSGLTVKIG